MRVAKIQMKHNMPLLALHLVYHIHNLIIERSMNILWSPIKLKIGYLNVAGLFCSMKKCEVQARPYALNAAVSRY